MEWKLSFSTTLSFWLFVANLTGSLGYKKASFYKDLFRGIVVKVLAYDFPPMFMVKKSSTGNFSYDGYFYDTALLIAEYFDASIEFVNADQTEFIKYGYTPAFLSQLKAQKVDIILFNFEMEWKLLDYMLVSSPIFIARTTLLQPWPESENRLRVIIRPFDWIIWACFFGSTIVFIWLSSLLIRYENIMDSKNKVRKFAERDKTSSPSLGSTVYAQLEYVLTIITSQGNSVPYTSRIPLRILLICWLLSMVVVINAYFGVLTSLSTIPKLEPTVDTLDQLATNRKLRVTAEKGGLLANSLLDAESGTNKILGDSLRSDPVFLFSNWLDLAENVLHRHAVYLGAEQIINFIISTDRKSNGKCRMTVGSRPTPYFIPYIIGIGKESRFVGAEVQVILDFWSGGLVSHFVKKSFPASAQCQANTQPTTDSHIDALKLMDLASAFLVLVLGLSLSILAFIGEKITEALVLHFD